MTINDSKKENLTPEELEKTSGGYYPSTTPNKFELAAGTIAAIRAGDINWAKGNIND